MSPRKPTGRPPGRPKGPKRAILMVRLEPGQAKAVRAEAKRRQKETGAPWPDVSAVIRWAVDGWIAQRETSDIQGMSLDAKAARLEALHAGNKAKKKPRGS